MSTNNPFQIHPSSSRPKRRDLKLRTRFAAWRLLPRPAAGSFEYRGQTYYFCGKGCLAKFQADPLKYLAPKPAVPAATARPKDVEYTCPMHPEVVQMGPGTCPICGMALEPKEIQAGDTENPELADMQRRFWVSVVLSLPLVVISMAMLGPHASPELGRTGSGDACGPLGRLAILRARLAVAWLSASTLICSR